MNPQDPLTPIQACFLPHQLAAQRDAEAALARALVPPLTPEGAWVEPGRKTDVSTNTDSEFNASLPSVEACETVGVAEEQPQVAGEQLADSDTSLNISFPSLTSSEACGGDIQQTPTNSQLVTPSLTPLW